MPRWTEQQLRDSVAESDSVSDVLRRFGLRPAGGNHALAKRWILRWDISTEHFTHGGDRFANSRPAARPLEEVLVEHSRYSRSSLKKRLYKSGLKARCCELCGLGEEWRGSSLSLVLDHVNGVADDNRLENLRIVCPNCNATLPTHCRRNIRTSREPRPCALCGEVFRPRLSSQRYCSRACGSRSSRYGPNPAARKVERPPYEQLLEEIATSSWSAVGRKYGVSCNAVRKWVKAEQRLRGEATGAPTRAGGQPDEPPDAD